MTLYDRCRQVENERGLWLIKASYRLYVQRYIIYTKKRTAFLGQQKTAGLGDHRTAATLASHNLRVKRLSIQFISNDYYFFLFPTLFSFFVLRVLFHCSSRDPENRIKVRQESNEYQMGRA